LDVTDAAVGEPFSLGGDLRLAGETSSWYSGVGGIRRNLDLVAARAAYARGMSRRAAAGDDHMLERGVTGASRSRTVV
jgi:hypothetical protein